MGNPVFRRDPSRAFRVWNIKEIFTGDLGVTTEHLYVPNVEDLVVDGKGVMRQVIAVDPVSAIPTMVVINGEPGDITDPDSIIDGLRARQPHGINRIFVDNSTVPATVTVHSRYRIYGSEATQAKLFKGTDTSDNGQVISHTLNSSNIIVSEMIDLVPLYDTNNTIKRPPRFHTTTPMEDGELVTLVVYAASGRVVDEYPFIIRNANMISGPTATNIYIEDIELLSDLLSDDDPKLIEHPLHVPVTTTMMQCRVHYSNGDKADHAIDGSKVKLHGVNSFNTSIIGPTSNVVLSYYPDPSEPSINLQGSIRPSISKTYKLTTVGNVTDVAYKLYVVPIWTGTEYRLVYRLTDVAYESDIDVTEYVTTTRTDGTAFKGNDFSREQTVNAVLDMSRINPNQTPPYVHVQQYKITLDRPGSSDYNDYVIDYGGDGYTYFGNGHYATAGVTGDHKFKVDINQSNKTDWLSWLYRAVDPIFDSSITDRGPEPTHFRLEHGGTNGNRLIGTFDISKWRDEFALGTLRNWEQGYPMNIVFIVRANGQDKVIGIAPLSIKYIYSGS